MPVTCQRPVPSPAGSPRRYAADERAPGKARGHAREQLGAWGLGGLAEDMMTVVSELVANAVLHGSRGAGGQVALRLEPAVHGVVVKVWDASPELPELRSADLWAESGNGLRLVESLSSGWGWFPAEGGGKVVWAACGIGQEADYGKSHLLREERSADEHEDDGKAARQHL
jgi:anti-sigma regulatory factor (Ser/Thr protein kinase)